ncbi:MAG: citrate transporter [Schlesneria sp.]|nr:citrate transporter [Schlesneria sp.]
MQSDLYHLAVLFGSLALLMTLVVRGKSIFVVAPLCAVLALTLSGTDPVAGMNGPYMTGFADYVRRFYLIFALGAVFGKVMDESGAAISVANNVGRWLGTQRACLSVVLACACLTYGGVSLFVVGFSVYPLAVQLFRSANLPRQFIPAAIAFGSITFTMTSAGSPEIQNLIPIKYLIDAEGKPLTDARAGWQVSLIVAFLMFAIGQLYLDRVILRAVAAGGKFEPRDSDRPAVTADTAGNPGFVSAVAPLVATLLALNLIPALCLKYRDSIPEQTWSIVKAVIRNYPEDGTLAIFIGVMVAVVLHRKRLHNVWGCFGDGFVNGLLAVGSTSAVVGFGSAVKDLPAFHLVVHWVTHLPGDPLISAALAVAVIAGIAGSASGGQGIALPIIKPIYIDELGVSARALHRVIAISSGSLDSLPANGYLVMLIRNICGETHARSYGPIFVTTVLVPTAGTAIAIALFKWFPQWG